jgi:hypothetical protein
VLSVHVHHVAKTGRKETKQKIGSVRLPVAEVVRNGKIRDTWALQDTQKGDIALSLVVRRLRSCALHACRWPLHRCLQWTVCMGTVHVFCADCSLAKGPCVVGHWNFLHIHMRSRLLWLCDSCCESCQWSRHFASS